VAGDASVTASAAAVVTTPARSQRRWVELLLMPVSSCGSAVHRLCTAARTVPRTGDTGIPDE